MRAHICFLVACLALAASAAPSAYERPVNGDCVPGGSADGVDLFPEQFMIAGESKSTGEGVEVTNAQGFSVQYFDTYKVVNNSIAKELYVLYQCGAAEPDHAKFPAGTKFFQIPLVSVSVPETIPYAAMTALYLTDRVYNAPAYVTAPCGQALLACNRVAPDSMSLDNTTLLAESVGAVTDGLLVTSNNTWPTAFSFSSSEDPGVLNRAEWIKFLGLFFNKEREASQAFQAMQEQYNELKDTAAAAGGAKPTLAFISHFAYGSAESYQMSWAPYKVQLVVDAGGQMLSKEAVAGIQGVQPDSFSDANLVFSWGAEGVFASKQAALDAFLSALSKVDIVIDESYSVSPNMYDSVAFILEYGLDTVTAESQPWSRKVYREDGLLSADMGMDWYEGALMKPAELLRDFVRVIHPELVQDATSFTWIRNLYTEKPVVKTSADCAAPTSCDATPVPICPFVTPCPTDNPAYKVAPALLKGTVDGACIYEKCSAAPAPQAGSGGDATATAQGNGNTNGAALAAPAVIMLTLVVILVEALLNC